MSAATITTYQWYLAIHILAVTVWVGGGLGVHLFALRARAANDPHRMAAFSADAEFIGTRVLMPASVLAGVFGFLLVHEGHWDYKFWIVFPIVVWVGSFALGGAFLGPQSKRLGAAIERGNVAEATAIRDRIFLVSRVMIVLLVLVVLDMALKPGS
jgi:uncharacterized membrane protein